MSEKNSCNSRFCWIIITLCWISCYDSFKTDNLRRNPDESRCMSELVSRDLLSDDQFTASSHFENTNIFQPKMARLLNIHSQISPGDGRAWCPATPVHKVLTEWIEVDFRRLTFIRTLYTMGRGDGNFKEFTPEIVIKYQRTESGPWLTYYHSMNETTDANDFNHLNPDNLIIPINTDSRLKHSTRLQTIVVRKIRIFPLDTRTGPKLVCLKIAFFGCYFNDEVVSYTAPQGDRDNVTNHLINLRDERYDGSKSQILQHGLGILMDNIVLVDKVAADDIINKEINSFVTGWKCTKDRSNRPISVIFFFDEERIFSEMSVFYVRNVANNITLTYPIVVSIGYGNDTHRSIFNSTTVIRVSDSLLKIPLNQQKGTICTLSITCGNGNWIILHEVEIKSVKSLGMTDPMEVEDVTHFYYHSTTAKSEKHLPSSPLSESPRPKEYVLYLMAAGLTIALLVMLLGCGGFMYYKMRRLRKNKLNKKLELVTKCRDHNSCDPSGRNIFTIQSKQMSQSSIGRPNYYPESKQTINNTYAGSQLSDAVYASWPNTDEDADVPNLDKEEEKCLLGTDIDDNKSSNKDYAIYQPGVTFAGSDYFHNSRPSSTLISVSSANNFSEKLPLSVAHLKIAPTYDMPKSTPIVTYRNSNNVISYQHLINYRGICGDVDLRYQSMPARVDHHGLDSNVKVVSTTSIIFVQPWVRGQFGCIDLVTVALNNIDTGLYFMKKLSPDSPNNIKSKFIADLKILCTLNTSSLARLSAIVVDGDLLSGDVADVIRCARFYLLIEHNGGYNLKDFLKNIYYPNQTQIYKTTTLSSQSQISLSSMLLIITQISSGLRYLEELGLTHRDVGCRNCIIDSRRQVKLYPGGYVTTQPFDDYCSIDLQNYLINFPLRWMAPESISKGLYTTKSDVWSFGVLMWEVFTLCSLMPYPSLSNEALLELIIDRENSPRLPCPQNCPREMYDLMTQCWSWDESLRPTFVDINMFLQIKTTGPSTPAQLILPAPPPLSMMEFSGQSL